MNTGLQLGSFSFAQSFVRLATQAAAPNFELRFSLAQNAAVDRLNEKITEINESDFGRGKSALLRIKSTRLTREKDEVAAYKNTVQTNWFSVKSAQTQLAELRALADPSSVAEFDAKLAQVQDTYSSFRTAKNFRFAAPDGLNDAKKTGLSQLAGITHNNFATQADIDSVQATIDSLTTELNASFTIIDVNFTQAKNLFKSVDVALDKANLKIEDLEVAERESQVAEIKTLEEEISRILTTISLSFEVAQDFTKFINNATILPQEIEPGAVLNLFA